MPQPPSRLLKLAARGRELRFELAHRLLVGDRLQATLDQLDDSSGQGEAAFGGVRVQGLGRPRPTPASSRRARRDQSAEDPGDEAEAIDWMDGLSSRLSAYSLADDGAEPNAQGGGDGKDDDEDTEA